MNESNYVMLYSKILLYFGLEEFSVSDIVERFGSRFGGTPMNIMVQRLYSKGYLDRVRRGIYRAVPPYVYMLGKLGYGWRESIYPDYRLLMDVLVSGIVDHFMDRLVSIVLFGSLARGDVHKYSDIDLLVVVDDIPKKYGERVRLLAPILEKVSRYRIKLWSEKEIYPDIDIILLDRDDASIDHPFYLDLVTDALIIYDRDGFMEKRIGEVRNKLTKLGAMKIGLPDGRYYWVLKPGLKWGEVVEL